MQVEPAASAEQRHPALTTAIVALKLFANWFGFHWQAAMIEEQQQTYKVSGVSLDGCFQRLLRCAQNRNRKVASRPCGFAAISWLIEPSTRQSRATRLSSASGSSHAIHTDLNLGIQTFANGVGDVGGTTLPVLVASRASEIYAAVASV